MIIIRLGEFWGRAVGCIFGLLVRRRLLEQKGFDWGLIQLHQHR
jgi:hypothetical protein